MELDILRKERHRMPLSDFEKETDFKGRGTSMLRPYL